MQRRLESLAAGVGDAAALDEDTVEPAAVRLAVAAEMVVIGERRELDRRRERELRPPRELGSEALDAPFREQIFEAGVPAVGAVAVVAEDRRDDADRLHRVLRRHEAERLRQPGGRVGLVVGHAQPAAHQDVEAGDQGQILGDAAYHRAEQIRAVVPRQRRGMFDR